MERGREIETRLFRMIFNENSSVRHFSAFFKLGKTGSQICPIRRVGGVIFSSKYGTPLRL
jgi:hypothetical protein